ncbi:hypothetical protein ACFWN5_37600 [Streptomyces sp. NPDC058430]|uniref:hypothetical protein n=1 Tax=unclassified Streptomyces TaxID=2593676 RepID=UPI00364F5D73
MDFHIDQSVFRPVRAVAAEHVLAHWPASQGSSLVVKGGRTQGHDIVKRDQLVDAKLLVAASNTEQKKYPGCTHTPCGAFDPTRRR